ncbi:hypothetical protein AMD01_04650 [Priestia koreensis]|uniref:Uncharacterized protein n=1 Tax=Priestia koreensis TaxID=284581 RepID=A0A0M0LBR6_9BACI|nr:hypothetical protein AMD01_04650 [Priestia koreensis]
MLRKWKTVFYKRLHKQKSALHKKCSQTNATPDPKALTQKGLHKRKGATRKGGPLTLMLF